MAWQISLVTNYSDEYLLTLSIEDLEKLYQEKVENND